MGYFFRIKESKSLRGVKSHSITLLLERGIWFSIIMRLSYCFSLLSLLTWNVAGQAQWPIHDNGLNKVVEWYLDTMHDGNRKLMGVLGITTVI